MATFQELLTSVTGADVSRQRRIRLIHEIEALTGRRLLVYATNSSKGTFAPNTSIDSSDKTGFSDLLHNVRGEPLDILIHSPGGSVEAAEALVVMLRHASPSVRFIVPHTAKSAATMMALSGDSILMDHRSELGPIDSQVLMPLEHGASRWVPAQTILDGFSKAREIIEQQGPKSIPAYMPLITKYDLHLLEICQNALNLAEKLAEEWLVKYMLKGDVDQAKDIASRLANHKNYLSHGRPIGISQAQALGLNVTDMSQTPTLQEKVWELYLAIEHFFDHQLVAKMFENGTDISWCRGTGEQHIILQPPPMQPSPSQPPAHPQKKKKRK